MAQIVITIPNDKLSTVLDAYDQQYPGRPTTTTKAVWAKQKLVETVKDTTKRYLWNQAVANLSTEDVDIT